MPKKLYDEVGHVADATRLSRADTLRQAISLGLPVLMDRLSVLGPVIATKPLSKRELDRLYQRRDDDPDGIDLLMAGQDLGERE